LASDSEKLQQLKAIVRMATGQCPNPNAEDMGGPERRKNPRVPFPFPVEIKLPQNNPSHQQLEELSVTDPLTEVHNRRYFDTYFRKAWSAALITEHPLSILMVDIDYFKKVNDDYGHQAGDQCLKTVAAVVAGCLNRRGDEVMRYGGEEFAVILPNSNEAEARIVAERIREAAAAQEIELEDQMIKVTLSIGIATLSRDSRVERQDILLSLADEALYQAKDQGRNLVIHFQDTLPD